MYCMMVCYRRFGGENGAEFVLRIGGSKRLRKDRAGQKEGRRVGALFECFYLLNYAWCNEA